VGQFISKDPLSGSAGVPLSRNRYAYALANPLRYTDTLGLAADPTGGDQGVMRSGAILSPVSGAISGGFDVSVSAPTPTGTYIPPQILSDTLYWPPTISVAAQMPVLNLPLSPISDADFGVTPSMGTISGPLGISTGILGGGPNIFNQALLPVVQDIAGLASILTDGVNILDPLGPIDPSQFGFEYPGPGNQSSGCDPTLGCT
jgi:hypothetical protein